MIVSNQKKNVSLVWQFKQIRGNWKSKKYKLSDWAKIFEVIIRCQKETPVMILALKLILTLNP